MADVQLENGFTRIANDILEALAKAPLNGTQFRILAVVLRYTYGFNRKEAKLSESYLSVATGINKRQVRRELKAIIEFQIVKIIEEATFNSSRIIAFNKDFSQWTNSPQMLKKTTEDGLDHSAGDELDRSTEDGLDPQEIQSLKTTLKTDHSSADSRFKEFWQAYPKKVGKGAAEKSFKKYKPDDSLLVTMLKAIEVQKKSEQWQKDNQCYVPNPSTWLNQRRWEDEIGTTVDSINDSWGGIQTL